jgi:hypothetical protein
MRNERFVVAGWSMRPLVRALPWALAALWVSALGCRSSSGTDAPAAPAAQPGAPADPAPAGPTLRSISVAPATASIVAGGDQPFVATGHYSDGTTAPLPLARWSSSNASCASVVADVGVAHAVAAGGPVTVTATDDATGISGDAVLTVTPATLRSLAVSPAVVSIPAGFTRRLDAVGQYSDGSSRTLSAGVTWQSSNGSVAPVDAAGVVRGVSAGGPVTVTATDTASGVSGTASLTVLSGFPIQTVAAVPFAGVLDASGASFYRVGGLDPSVEYLVRASSAGTAATPIVVDVDTDASYASLSCRTFVDGPPCRAGAPTAAGDLFLLVSGPTAAGFFLDVSPVPVLEPGAAAATGFVATETYFKVPGATGGTVQVTVSGLSDPFADVFVYDGDHGPIGSGLLCSTVLSSAGPSKSCLAPAIGPVYVTVEGWLTAAGTDYALAVAAP